MRSNFPALVAVVLSASAASMPAPAATSAIYSLGTLGGSSSVSDVNASGQIVGASNAPGGQRHGFRYTGTPGSGDPLEAL